MIEILYELIYHTETIGTLVVCIRSCRILHQQHYHGEATSLAWRHHLEPDLHTLGSEKGLSGQRNRRILHSGQKGPIVFARILMFMWPFVPYLSRYIYIYMYVYIYIYIYIYLSLSLSLLFSRCLSLLGSATMLLLPLVDDGSDPDGS